MPGQLLEVTDKATGKQFSIEADAYDPEQFDLVEGQQLAVEESQVTGASRGAAAESALATGGLSEQLGARGASDIRHEQAVAARHGGVGEQVLQGLKGAASGATFGLYDLAAGAGSTSLEREEERYAREAGPGHALGTIAGAVAPALLSGGTGIGGTLARMTPAGRLGAATTRWAAKGGLRGSVAGGAVEGFAGAVGDSIARRTLDADPDMSASALVSDGLMGAVLGGGIGALGAGASKLAQRSAAKAQKAAADIPITTEPAGFVGIFGKQPPKLATKGTRYKSIVRKQLADESADNARALGARLDTMSSRSAITELDDLALKMPAGLGDDSARLIERARRAADKYDEAGAQAKSWYARFSDDVQLDKAQKRLTRDVGEDVQDEGITALGRYDESAHELDRIMDELSTRAGVQRASMAAPLDEAGVKLNRTLGESATTAAGKVKRAGEGLLGAAETAQSLGVDTGLPSVRDIPVIGALASAYLQVKTGLNVARGRGLVPASAATRAASKTVSLSERLAEGAKMAASGALRKIAASPAARLVPSAAARQITMLRATPPATSAKAADEEARDTTDAVRMATAATTMRAQQYLLANAPSDPTGGQLPGEQEWEPSTQETLDWQRRIDALADPAAALVLSTSNPLSQLEVDAVRAVYPPVWRQYRSELQANAPEMVQNLPVAQLVQIGQNFDLLLTVANLPQYGAIAGPMEQAEQQTMNLGQPSASTTAPSVTTEQTSAERRAR